MKLRVVKISKKGEKCLLGMGLSMNVSGRHKQVLCMRADLDLILSIHQPALLPTTSNLHREEWRGKGGDFAN